MTNPTITLGIVASGPDPLRHGIVQLAATKLSDNQWYYAECRLRHGLQVDMEHIKRYGIDINSIETRYSKLPPYHPTFRKPVDTAVISDFFRWLALEFSDERGEFDPIIAIGYEVSKGLQFIKRVCDLYNLVFPFSDKFVDLRDLAMSKIGSRLNLDEMVTGVLGRSEPPPRGALSLSRLYADLYAELSRP